MKRAPALSFLIKTECLIPLIISGKGRLPPSERIVDMKPEIISLHTRYKQPYNQLLAFHNKDRLIKQSPGGLFLLPIFQ